MRYEFKVGDKGKTRCGEHYEVVAILPGEKMPVVVSVGEPGRKQAFAALQCGSRCFDGSASASDLMPPEPESRDCYLWVADDGDCKLVRSLADAAYMDRLIGSTKAIKPLTIRDGEGLKLLEAWRDERAKKSAPEPLWPGRVVYDLECVTDAGRIEACLKDGRMLYPCGLQWRKTPQGHDWWWPRSWGKPLSDEARAALEDLLAQYRFANGERYEIGDWVSDREKLVKSIDEHDCLIDAFGWASTPEGHNYWGSIRRNGHDWQSRVKLKVMLLSIAAHDAALSDRDDLGESE